MRIRFAVLASALAALAVVAVPSISGAAPKHNRGLTINATPNPIDAGDGVYIYGQLEGSNVSGKTIVLYHHISGTHTGYTRIGSTKTNSFGFYSFTRAVGVVMTNRSWYTREAGVSGVHSRTVYERVRALVNISDSSSTGTTRHPITFSGHVTPNHAGERVLLQEQKGNTDDWTTLKSVRLGPGSNYSAKVTWLVPGEYDIRAVFPGDNRNIRGVSDTESVTIQQAQVADFTINSSSPVIPEGSTATISGTLFNKGTTTPEGSTTVALWSRSPDQAKFHEITTTMTAADGTYSFTVQPTRNTFYEVRTVSSPIRHTAQLFEGVKDVVTISGPSTSTVGGKVTFTGTVSPDKAGHHIYLQRLGADGDWHTVAVSTVRGSSTYKFSWTFGATGAHQFRARVPSDENNVGAASPAITVTVSGVTPPSSLPPAS